ncbi:carbohydrate ABC transporter permease [Thermosulfuriphilus ammonigenes]|uniref:Carbohydrate ABC transporter permease n=1 Tax=Thermosulfuriphilus ammonigenes TaxID=1936021 RepID=A0A6G7PXE3_9BACT|nr:carbohydrate ABC transporter permease [Thermosulfuriphilus ammonigenes]MBA2847712.1 ABC-type glycerol-3-phosphate transport system permease component [Thermosulfuriphilus ammonigenes]QIJ72083.1 carbohydrate ABC transporter permease [Thermosulfuriphilus ammonigenes]
MRQLPLIVIAGVIILFSLFPFYWTVVTAIKPPEAVFELPPTYWPRQWSLENFEKVFIKRPFGRYVANSILVATGATGLCLTGASILAAYLRRLSVVRALWLQRWLLVLAIIPPTVLVIPIFWVIHSLGLINHPLGLVLSYTILNLPFAVWILYAGFSRIPRELDEAARVDGLSFWEILWYVLLPLGRPSLAVCAALVFIFCWNEFLIALTLMPDEKHYTVPVGVAMLSGSSVYEIPWGEINAAVTITTLPVILMVVLLKRWILEGLTSGAIKG